MHRIEKNRVRPLGKQNTLQYCKATNAELKITHPKKKKERKYTSLRQHPVCINNVAVDTDTQPQMPNKTENRNPDGLLWGVFSEQLSLKSSSQDPSESCCFHGDQLNHQSFSSGNENRG